jgi:hypothetical protein
MTDLTTSTLTDGELADLKAQISVEEQRRLRVVRIPEQIKELNQQLLTDLGRGVGEPWAQPEGWWDAYPEGWLVRDDDGRRWRSKVNGNDTPVGDSAAWRVSHAEEG